MIWLCSFFGCSECHACRLILQGKHTETFRKKYAQDASSSCCFSIVSKKRSLDMEAKSRESRDAFLQVTEPTNEPDSANAWQCFFILFVFCYAVQNMKLVLDWMRSGQKNRRYSFRVDKTVKPQQSTRRHSRKAQSVGADPRYDGKPIVKSDKPVITPDPKYDGEPILKKKVGPCSDGFDAIKACFSSIRVIASNHFSESRCGGRRPVLSLCFEAFTELCAVVRCSTIEQGRRRTTPAEWRGRQRGHQQRGKWV